MRAIGHSVAMANARTFDVIVYGATGFTGSLVAHYFARKGETERWAIAGRNRQKLEELRRELSNIDARWLGLPIIEADSNDEDSLHAMAAQTKVVLTTAGPFIKYALPLVKACVEEGTHYCDITGEPDFVERTLEHHEQAKAKGIKVISCCGFDSIPHDLGAWLCARALPSDAPMTIRGFVRSKGTFSGGTFQTAIDFMGKGMGTKSKRRNDGSTRQVRPLKRGVHREPSLDCWAVPLPTIDPKIVRRSARVLEDYGPDFRYGHYAQIKKASTIVVGGAALGAVRAVASLEAGRRLLKKLKPAGTGPSKEERARSWFTATFLGEAGGQKSKVIVSGGDPGYDETAKMVSETALALAFDELPEHCGVVTPAVGLGQRIVDRLTKAGMGFETR